MGKPCARGCSPPPWLRPRPRDMSSPCRALQPTSWRRAADGTCCCAAPILNRSRSLTQKIAGISRIIDLKTQDFLCAGGQDKFVIVDRSANTMERWDLATMHLEQESPAPQMGLGIARAVMGSASDGPLLLISNMQTNAGSQAGPEHTVQGRYHHVLVDSAQSQFDSDPQQQ